MPDLGRTHIKLPQQATRTRQSSSPRRHGFLFMIHSPLRHYAFGQSGREVAGFLAISVWRNVALSLSMQSMALGSLLLSRSQRLPLLYNSDPFHVTTWAHVTPLLYSCYIPFDDCRLLFSHVKFGQEQIRGIVGYIGGTWWFWRKDGNLVLCHDPICRQATARRSRRWWAYKRRMCRPCMICNIST